MCDPEAFTGIGFGLLTWAATVAEPHPSNGQVEATRPLKAEALNKHSAISITSHCSKQVIRPAQIQGKEKKTLPLDWGVAGAYPQWRVLRRWQTSLQTFREGFISV